MDYSWDFGPVIARFDMLAIGFLNTIKIAIVSILLGVVVGLVLVLMRLSPRKCENGGAKLVHVRSC